MVFKLTLLALALALGKAAHQPSCSAGEQACESDEVSLLQSVQKVAARRHSALHDLPATKATVQQGSAGADIKESSQKSAVQSHSARHAQSEVPATKPAVHQGSDGADFKESSQNITALELPVQHAQSETSDGSNGADFEESSHNVTPQSRSSNYTQSEMLATGSESEQVSATGIEAQEDPDGADFKAAKAGEDVCPDGYTVIKDATECKSAAKALGYKYYHKTSDMDDELSVCNYCGGCSYLFDGGKTVRIDSSHDVHAKWICKAIPPSAKSGASIGYRCRHLLLAAFVCLLGHSVL